MSRLPALILASLSTAAVFAQSVSIEGMQGLGDVRHHEIVSTSNGESYHVLIGLPHGYADSGGERFPTVYVLDGGELFPLFASYSRYLRHAEEVPDLILVGISYGTDDWEAGNNRGHDYTAHTDEREHWGGADDFQSFLADELLPMIESEYRSRRDRRIVFGQSLGGQFVLYTAQTRPHLFWGHIASNPALHRNLPFFLELHGEPDPARERSHLFVASGSDDDPRFREPALEWIGHWTGAESTPWDLRAVTLDGHGHFSAPPASFRQGLMWLFGVD